VNIRQCGFMLSQHSIILLHRNSNKEARHSFDNQPLIIYGSFSIYFVLGCCVVVHKTRCTATHTEYLTYMVV